MVQLRKIILTGVFWSTVNQVLVQIVGLAVLALLARLLSPADFGLIAMVTIATGFLEIIRNFGLGAALVQKSNVSDDEFSTVFWLNVALGAVLSVSVFLLAEPIGLFYNEPKVTEITQVLSVTFFLKSIGVIWANKMLKEVDFKQIFIRNFTATILAGIISIYFAWIGYGYWALVIQTFVRTITGLFFNYLRVKWLPSLVFDKSYLRGLVAFSLPLFADKSMNYWMRNTDNLLVGKFLGKTELAFYTKAYSLMLLPVRQLSGTISKVLFPSFSLIQNDVERIGSVYLKISRVIAFISFPVMVCLSIAAEPFVLIIYGDQWTEVIPIFQVLSFLGMFQSIGTLSGNIFLSTGKTRLMFKLGLFSRLFMIGGITIGLYLGELMGMVYGYCLTSFLAFLPELYFTGGLIKLSLKRIVLNFSPYFLVAGFCGLIVYLILPQLKVGSSIYNLSITTAVFFLMYIGLSFMLKLTALSELTDLVKSILNKEK